MPLRLAISAVLAFALAAAAGGCAGDGSLQQTLSSMPGEADKSTAGASSDAPAFDPFRDPAATAVGGRDVIRNPTRAEIMQTGTLPEMAVGRADAPVTIIKYMSLTCPYCRQFQTETYPVLKREYIDTGKVRLILREFPIGFQSGAATIALRCAPPEKYFDLYGRFMAQQAQWVSQEVRTEPIFRIAQQVGMTREQFDACRQNQGMIKALNGVKERGRTLGIIGTPNFFINDRLVKNVIGMKEIREMVEPMLAGRVAGGAAPAN